MSDRRVPRVLARAIAVALTAVVVPHAACNAARTAPTVDRSLVQAPEAQAVSLGIEDVVDPGQDWDVGHRGAQRTETYGDDDAALYQEMTGAADRPRSADGSIDEEPPKIAAWRSRCRPTPGPRPSKNRR